MTKMTYAVAIDSALKGEVTAEVREKLEALKAQLAKRHSGTRKPTKIQKENVGLKDNIFAFISEEGAKRAGEVAVHFGVSGQKASALLKQMVEEGRLEKYAEKRVTYFKVVEEE